MTWDWCYLSNGHWGRSPKGAALSHLDNAKSQLKIRGTIVPSRNQKQRKEFDMLEGQKKDQGRIIWNIVIEQEDGRRGSQRYK